MKENHFSSKPVVRRGGPAAVLTLSLLVLLSGCSTTEPKKTEMDEVPVLQPGPMAWIPIVTEIGLRPPAKVAAIQIAGGSVTLKVSEAPTLRTLGHIADGSVTYLLAPTDAQKLAAKHGSDRYLFSHARNATMISRGGPREWVEQAIRTQLSQANHQVQPDTGTADARAIQVQVKNLILAVGAKGTGVMVDGTVTMDVALLKGGQAVAQREIIGKMENFKAGMFGTPNDNGKALQLALEDALLRIGQFVRETDQFSR